MTPAIRVRITKEARAIFFLGVGDLAVTTTVWSGLGIVGLVNEVGEGAGNVESGCMAVRFVI
jgi:hypothetical protein